MKEVSAMFADENATNLEARGYTRGESEVGSVYYVEKEVEFGPQPKFKLLSVWKAKHILTFGIRPAGN